MHTQTTTPLPLDAPHWWGYAALPDGVDYPMNGDDNPLTLICQFHHGDGMLSLFADLDYYLGDYDAPAGPMGRWPANFYRVIWSPSRQGLHEHKICYPDGTSAVPPAEPLDAPRQRSEVSHVWGEAEYFTDEVAQDYPGYRVLMQLDENDHLPLRFYDCGSLFFLIPEDDAAANRFDRVVCVLYSY
ncbi:MAG: DUF1963 domain-containing protein [Prevotellamassilia sp.]|nr:DUF1963 domain-containing protein [Prevotellamassilia sp.]